MEMTNIRSRKEEQNLLLQIERRSKTSRISLYGPLLELERIWIFHNNSIFPSHAK